MRNELYARNPKTVRYGRETISFLSPKILSLIPQNIKDSGSLPCFNRIHGRALRTVYSYYNSSFNELLDKDGSFTIHQRNVQSLAIEIYKYLHGLFPAILSEVFKVNETIPYDSRMHNELYARNPKTVRYGTETISFLSPKICSLIPQNIKDSGSLPCFKQNIRK